MSKTSSARFAFAAIVSLSLVIHSAVRGDETDPVKPAAIETENVPAIPSTLLSRLHQYEQVRSASMHGWASDGHGLLIATRFAETVQLHRVYEPGGRREQVTFFAEPATGRFIPRASDGALLATFSEGGNENQQIVRVNPATGAVARMTDGKSRNLLGPVSRDGASFLFASNRRNGQDMDIYEAKTMGDGEARLVFRTDGEYWTPTDWSPDGKAALILRYVSINESYPAILDLRTGQKRDIPLPGEGLRSVGSLRFASDGKSVFLTSDALGEYLQLARVDLDSFEYHWLTLAIPWDVTDIDVDPVGSATTFVTNENGASRIYLQENDQYQPIDIPMGIVGGIEFSPNGKQIGFTLSRPDAPSDVFSVEVSSGALTRWTYSELGGLDPNVLTKPTRITFGTFDDREIPAYYFKPSKASPTTPVGVVIRIHGGPEGQYRPYFSEFDQFLLNEVGIAVIHPNVRGSTGYGKTYVVLDNGIRREDSVRDIGALLDWIAKQPELDASRVAVYGGSYGGYMVLASLTHFPHRLKAGIDVVGIASFQSFLANTSPYRQDLRRAEYGDERDPTMQAFFKKIDPVNNAGKITSELLIAHGRNDPRVPFSEAERIVPAVTANGQKVWTVYAGNEGHGFAKKANRDYLYAVIAMFLEETLDEGGSKGE